MLILLLSSAMAGTLPPGEVLDNAVAVHVSQGGLDTLASAVAGLVPTTFEEPSIAGEFECDAGDDSPLGYAINGFVADIEVTDVGLVASDGRLDLDLDLALTATADEVAITGDCTFLFADLDQSCGLEITAADPITLGLHLGIEMELLDDGSVDVTVDDLSYDLGSVGNPLTDCSFATLVDVLLEINPTFLEDLIASFIDPLLADLPATLESSLEEPLSSLVIETTVPLLDVDLDLALFPTELTLSDTGLFLGLGGQVAVSEISDCVDAGEGSEITSDGWPAYGETAWDEGGYPYDMGILVNKDFLDHLLWNVWASGILCGDVGDLIPLPLGTDFLGNLYGESFQALFPEDQAVELTLEAPYPLTSTFGEEVPFIVNLNALGLNTATGLDERMTRVCQIGMSGEIGLDPGVSSTEIVPALILDTESFVFSEDYTELLDDGYSVGFGETLPGLIESFLPEDLLPTVALPTFQGVGLGEVVWIPEESGQWQGGFATLDTTAVEPIEIDGCSGCESGELPIGCDTTSCSDGCGDCSGGTCATGGKAVKVAQGRLVLFAVLFSLIGLRRRRL